MGRQLIASVLYVINEVELSIYRFLSSGAKKVKGSLNRSSRGSTGSLVVEAFNALACYRCLDRTSTRGKESTSTGKRRLLDERKCF